MRTLFFYVFFNAKGEVIDPMNKRRMRLMGKLVAQNKWLFIGAALCVLISVVIDYLTPLLLAETLDYYLRASPPPCRRLSTAGWIAGAALALWRATCGSLVWRWWS